MPPMPQETIPLCDGIWNTRALGLQVEPTFDTYNGERDPMAHINAFEMKFKLQFGINDNLMAKYLPTTFYSDALNWYFALPTWSIICYAQLISQFYIHLWYQTPWKITLTNLINSKQGPNEHFDKFAQWFQKTWSTIVEPLSKHHIVPILLQSLHPKLYYTFVYYETLPFSNIIPKMISKERGLIDISRLNYRNPSKYNKPPRYHKN